MSALQDEAAPAAGATPPELPGGLGMRALRNTILILIVRVISRIIALVAVIIIGNFLEPTRFGEMQTAVTYVGLVGTLTDLGFSALYVREGARHTNELARYWNNVASLKVVGAIVGLPLIFAALYIAGVRSLLWPCFAILVLSGYQLLLRNTLYALQRLTFEIIEIIPETLIVFALVLIGVHIQADTGFFLWAYAISYGFACVYFGTVLLVMGVLRPGLQFETAAAPVMGARCRPARDHVHHHHRVFQGRRSHPAALPAVQRGGLLHLRVQAVRVPPLHSVRVAKRHVPGAFPVSPAIARARASPGREILQGAGDPGLADHRRRVPARAPVQQPAQSVQRIRAGAADPLAGDRLHVRRQHLRSDAQRDRQTECLRVRRHGRAGHQRRSQSDRDPPLRLPRRQLGGGGHRGCAGGCRRGSCSAPSSVRSGR